MRENCLQEFDKHWNCLELNNQVREVSLVIGALTGRCRHAGVQVLPETRAGTQQVHV